MASMTPGAMPEVVALEIMESPFNSRSFIITVGPAQVRFSVHEAKLAQTSFFEIHTELTDTQRAQLQAVPIGSDRRINQAKKHDSQTREVKLEDGSTHLVRAACADYHVEDRFFLDPAAFDVFVKYLYNEPPVRPVGHKQLKILLKTYGIARTYDCYGLQNKILDCIRAYYARTRITLDDLIWVSNRLGDGTACALNIYLVEQIAYEIAAHGLLAFSEKNKFMKTFLESGNRAIRGTLFEALARHAQKNGLGDPAEGRNKFHVHLTGDLAGKIKVPEEAHGKARA